MKNPTMRGNRSAGLSGAKRFSAANIIVYRPTKDGRWEAGEAETRERKSGSYNNRKIKKSPPLKIKKDTRKIFNTLEEAQNHFEQQTKQQADDSKAKTKAKLL